jgi:hypothetical protein
MAMRIRKISRDKYGEVLVASIPAAKSAKRLITEKVDCVE